MPEVVKRTLPRGEFATFTSRRVFAPEATLETPSVATSASDELSANATRNRVALDWIDRTLLVNRAVTITHPRVDEKARHLGA